MRPIYRLSSDTLGILLQQQGPTLVTIPKGARVTIANAKVGSRMLDVQWEGATVSIFTQDLDERGTLEPSPKSPASDANVRSKNAATG